MEFEPEVEEQQDQAERGEHLQVVRVGDQHDAGRVRAEEDPGQDEEGDGRQADAAADAGQDGRGQKGAAHGDEGVCVSDGSSRVRPDGWSFGQGGVKKR